MTITDTTSTVYTAVEPLATYLAPSWDYEDIRVDEVDLDEVEKAYNAAWGRQAERVLADATGVDVTVRICRIGEDESLARRHPGAVALTAEDAEDLGVTDIEPWNERFDAMLDKAVAAARAERDAE